MGLSTGVVGWIAPGLLPAGRVVWLEAMVMEDPARPRGKVLNISRGAEPGRLARLVLPAAYQCVVPILRRPIERAQSRPGLSVASRRFKSMPRRAAGA